MYQLIDLFNYPPVPSNGLGVCIILSLPNLPIYKERKEVLAATVTEEKEGRVLAICVHV
jgi:hypothetical protein